jgi:preprotein translocase subunit SecE
VRNTTEQRAEGGTPGGLKQLVTFVPRSVEFVKEAWQELKKVHWPTSKETYSATLIVVVVVVAVSIFLGLVDFGLSFAMRQILGQS